MASRVNVKFVVILSLVFVVALAGALLAANYLFRNSAADLAKAGDKLMAQGQFKDAADLYAKAVNKEKTNVQILEKWRDALRSMTPETRVRYQDAYRLYIGTAVRQLAVVQRDNVPVQEAFLAERFKTISVGAYSRANYEDVARDADTFLAYHVTKPAGGEWEALKRYRALPRLRVVLESPDISPEVVESVRVDLEAALAARPNDAEVAIGLETWYAYQQQKALKDSRADAAAEQAAKGDAVVESFLEKNPGNAELTLVKVRRGFQKFAQQLRDNPEIADMARAMAEAQAAQRPLFDAAAAAALQQPATDLLINLMRQVESMADPASRLSRTESLIARAMELRPSDASLMLSRAEIMSQRDDLAGAVAQLDAVTKLPTPPVSFDGLMLFEQKVDAIFRQSLHTFRLWQDADTAEDKDRALASLRSLRSRLGESEEASSPRLVLCDAQLAFVESNLNKANQLLDQFNRVTNNSMPEALFLSAVVADRLNQPGAAKAQLEALLRVQGSNIGAAFYLAELEVRLQNFENAENLLRAILRVVPDNAQVKERLAIVQTLRGATTSDDPVTQALLDADRLSDQIAQQEAQNPGSSGGNARLVAFLQDQAAKQNQNPRLVQALVMAHMRENNRAGALEDVRKALAATPNDRTLKDLEIALSTTDPVESQLKLIDARTDAPPLQIALARYNVFKNAGRSEEARAELARAMEISPNEKSVIELRFMDALETNDLALAQELTDQAMKNDLDNAGGLTFRARLQAARGEVREAVVTMEQVIARGGVQPEAWRLMGRLHALSGRPVDAINSFRKALELRPADVECINDLVGTLAATGQRTEALATARQYLRYAQGDDEFAHNWLALEAGYGDRRVAIDRRERIAKANPDNRRNLIALASLYMDEGARDKARPYIDRVRASQDGLDAMNLDAAWYWAQGEQGRARAIFDQHIATLDPASKDIEPYLVYAQFLLQRQDGAGGLSVLESARAKQDPATMQADKAIADTQRAFGRFPDAADTCKRIIDAGADDDRGTYRKQLVECLMAQQKYEEADQALAPLAPKAESDVQVMILQSDVRGGLKDARGQRQVIDRAIARFPNEPAVFIRRGQIMMQNKDTLRDAVADFGKAIQLAPNMSQAYMLRAMAYRELGQTEETITDFRASLRANPNDNSLLGALIGDLLKLGREQDAQAVANENIERRPRDVGAIFAVGQTFASFGRWSSAAGFFRMAYERDKQPGVVQRYLDSLLNSEPPNIRDAEAVLAALGDRVATNAGFTMSQARVRMLQGRSGDAARTAVEAARLLDPSKSADMFAWLAEVRRMVQDPAALAGFMDSAVSAPGVPAEWLQYFRASMRAEKPETRDDAIATFRRLIETTQNAPLKQVTYRTLGSTLYGAGRFEEAAREMRSGLGEFQGDPELSNNLAFILAKELNKPAEAVPLAEAAAKALQTAEILDTLGAVYMMNGRNQEAIETLIRARELARNAQMAVTTSVHLADALHANGDTERARTILDEASTIAEMNPGQVSDRTKTDLQDVRKKITPP